MLIYQRVKSRGFLKVFPSEIIPNLRPTSEVPKPSPSGHSLRPQRRQRYFSRGFSMARVECAPGFPPIVGFRFLKPKAGRINLPIRWMEEILHQFIGGLSHYFQAFYHPRWCRIPSIHSITLRDLWIRVISRLHPIKVMMKPIINPNYQWVMKFGTKSSTASHIPLIFLYCNNNHS